MTKSDDHAIRIEAGQILHPNHFPPPNELVCIEVPKVFDQVSLRDCQSISGVNLPGTTPASKNVLFKQAYNFDITDIKVYNATGAMTKPGFKKLKLAVTVKFDIDYSFVEGNTLHEDTLQDFPVVFDLTVNEIYCPDCTTQIGLVRSPGGHGALDVDGSLIKVEGILDVFNVAVVRPMLPMTQFSLSFDIGAFFIVKCECIVQLLIPAYGYCPIPPEQANIAAQNCNTFNNRNLTPFPTQFFPDQKWNPLDRSGKEDWDD